MIKQKLKAAGIHGLVTTCVAIFTAYIVFLVWYKGAFSKMLSGTDLYLLVLGVEVCLGPLMSLVIYNPNKSRKELIRDYLIIGIMQLSALAYGIYSVALSRPVFLVFVKDRIEVVAAVELRQEDIALTKDKSFTSMPWFGPENICTESPTDPKEKSDLLFSGITGKDIQLMPKYYRYCHDNEVINKAYNKQDLFSITKIKPDDLPNDLQSIDFKWLPIVTRFNAWMVIYPKSDINSPVYINLNPFN